MIVTDAFSSARGVTPRFKLTFDGFMDPRWFNRFWGGYHPAIVGANHCVNLGGETLWLPGNTPLQVGEEIVVFSDQWFWCVRQGDVFHFQKVCEAEREQKRLAEEESFRQRMFEARAFNDRIRLPVKWDVAIKVVLSGLSANSWGDGRNRCTVQHILLLEPLRSGRINRRAGDLLCASRPELNGKLWTTREERGVGPGGEKYPAIVTCIGCLKIAKRWIHAP